MSKINKTSRSQNSFSPLKPPQFQNEIQFKTGMFLRISIHDSDGITHPDSLLCSVSLCSEQSNTYQLFLNESKAPIALFLTPQEKVKLSFEIQYQEIACVNLPYQFFLHLHTNSTYKWIPLQEDLPKSNGKNIRQQNVLFYFERVPLQSITPSKINLSPFRTNIDQQFNSKQQLSPYQQMKNSQSSSKRTENFISSEQQNQIPLQNRENTPIRHGNIIQPLMNQTSSQKSLQNSRRATQINFPNQMQSVITDLFLENQSPIKNSENNTLRPQKSFLVTPPPIKTGNDYSSISANSEIPRSLQNQFNGSPQSSVHDIFLPEFTPYKVKQNNQNLDSIVVITERSPLKEIPHSIEKIPQLDQKEIENREYANERLRTMINEFQANQLRKQKEEERKGSQLQILMNESQNILKRTQETEEGIQDLWQKEHRLEENIENLVEANSMIEADTQQMLRAIEGMSSFRLAQYPIEQFETDFRFLDFKTAEMASVYRCIYESKIHQLQIEKKRDIILQKKQAQDTHKRGFSLYSKIIPEKKMNAKMYLDVLKQRNQKQLSPEVIIGNNPQSIGSQMSDDQEEKSKRLFQDC